VSHGGRDVGMNVIFSPIFDDKNVKAGLDDQACLGE